MTGSLTTRFDFPFDADFILKDEGGITADDVWQVDSADKIIDLGAGQFTGCCLLDVTSVEVASGDELYEHYIQGSNSATFASGIVNLAMIETGDAAVLIGGADTDGGAGFYRLYFSNVRPVAGVNTIFRYIRGYTNVTGTIDTTGIVFSARVGRIDRSL